MQVAARRLHLRQVAQRQQRSMIGNTMQHSQDKVLLHVHNLLLSRAQHAASCSLNQVCTADYHAFVGQSSARELVNLPSTQQKSQSFRPSISRGRSACYPVRRGSAYGMACPEALGSLFLCICSADDWLHLSTCAA